ncbi:hypothetical protein FRC11_007971 [Ceratobasidium sp. 423]|nr:hypothetical protein FRC11_007971 [Ceratobasidium sp. 423]
MSLTKYPPGRKIGHGEDEDYKTYLPSLVTIGLTGRHHRCRSIGLQTTWMTIIHISPARFATYGVQMANLGLLFPVATLFVSDAGTCGPTVAVGDQ